MISTHAGEIQTMTDEKRLGRKVRELRKQQRLTQEEFAELAGFSIQHIGDIERGQANPTFSCLCRLAEVLGVSVSDFFMEPEQEEPNEWEMRHSLLAFITRARKKQLHFFIRCTGDCAESYLPRHHAGSPRLQVIQVGKCTARTG